MTKKKYQYHHHHHHRCRHHQQQHHSMNYSFHVDSVLFVIMSCGVVSCRIQEKQNRRQ